MRFISMLGIQPNEEIKRFFIMSCSIVSSLFQIHSRIFFLNEWIGNFSCVFDIV